MAIQIHILIVCCLTFYVELACALIGENVVKVDPGDFLYVASLLKVRPLPDGSMSHFCTGTLISNRDVITAANCMDGKKAVNLRVIVGSVDLNFNGHHYVQFWITYKNWAMKKNFQIDTDKHEVAIIRLSRAVQHIDPVVMSFYPSRDYIGKVVELAGWGVSQDGELTTIMEKVPVKVISHKECEIRSDRLNSPRCCFPERYLFTVATPYAQLSCGDSGGPILHDRQLIGINHGTCLVPDQIFHPDKINLHFGLPHYQGFIASVLTEYK